MFHSYATNYQSAMEFLCTNALGFPSCQWSSNSSSRQRRLSYHPGSADALKATVSQPKAGGFTSSSPYFPTFSHSIELYSLNIALCLQKLGFPTLLSTFCSFFPFFPFFPRKRPAFCLRRARHAPPDLLGSAAQGVGPACASPGARSGDRRSPRARYLWKREATRLRR